MSDFWISSFFAPSFWDLSSCVLTSFTHLLSWIVLQKHLSSSCLLLPYIRLYSGHPAIVTSHKLIPNHLGVVKTTTHLLSHSPSCDTNHIYPFTPLSVLAEQIHFTKRIHNVEVNERQSATFECEVSFDNAVVSWYKDTWELKESPKYNFTSEGRRHFMVIRNVTIEDEGV